MGWQRFNRGSNIFEVSDDNGASWQPLIIAAAGVNVPPLPANIAYTNVDNNFTALQTSPGFMVKSGLPIYYIHNTAEPVDQRLWRIEETSNLVRLIGVNDANNAYNTLPQSWYRNGDYESGRDILSGRDIFAGTDSAKGNLYTTYPVYPGRQDTGWTRQAIWWLGSNGSYGLSSNTGLRLEGPLYTAATVYEYNRATGIGHWVGYTPSSYLDLQGSGGSVGGTLQTMVVGKTLFLSGNISHNGSAGNPSSNRYILYIPNGPITPATQYFAYPVNVNGAWETGLAFCQGGGNYILLYRPGAQVWPAGNHILGPSVAVQIN